MIERAYNDAAGVTAAFNRSVLEHVNQLLGADFDPLPFRHHAFYNRGEGRVMNKVSERLAYFVHLAFLPLQPPDRGSGRR